MTDNFLFLWFFQRGDFSFHSLRVFVNLCNNLTDKYIETESPAKLQRSSLSVTVDNGAWKCFSWYHMPLEKRGHIQGRPLCSTIPTAKDKTGKWTKKESWCMRWNELYRNRSQGYEGSQEAWVQVVFYCWKGDSDKVPLHRLRSATLCPLLRQFHSEYPFMQFQDGAFTSQWDMCPTFLQ